MKTQSMKKLQLRQSTQSQHWVGDGFPVRNIFGYNDLAAKVSPFLMLDYAGPAEFPPTDKIRGVGEHPHRGFETVTIVYDGEVEHRDSSGGGGKIGPGDVQWMTAASGVVHEEMHGADFAKKGGRFEMIQLWVNLRAKDKMSTPGYQNLRDAEFPRVALGDDGSMLRVIAGEFEGHRGPAKTYSPMNLWDIRLRKGRRQVFRVPEGHTASIFVLSGKIHLEDGDPFTDAQLAVLETNGTEFSITADSDAKILFLGGEPFAEPIVGYGPFVMNSAAEIKQAVIDFHEGRMGQLVQTRSANDEAPIH